MLKKRGRDENRKTTKEMGDEIPSDKQLTGINGWSS